MYIFTFDYFTLTFCIKYSLYTLPSIFDTTKDLTVISDPALELKRQGLDAVVKDWDAAYLKF